MLPDALYFGFDDILEVRADERVSLLERPARPLPDWMEYPGPVQTGRTRVQGCRFWFDDRTMWPMEYVEDEATGSRRFDLGANPQCLSELAVARHLKLETKPGDVTEEASGARTTKGHLEILALANGAQLVRHLRQCLASLQGATPFAAVTIVDPPTPDQGQAKPMAARLEAARQARAQAPADDENAQVTSLLTLGQAAADALRPGEARAAFEELRSRLGRGLPLTPAIRRGLERLVEVDLLAERLDEAFAVAKALPENEHLLAAIALSRGDYDGASLLACAAAGRILGRPFKDWNELSLAGTQDFRMELISGLAPNMRRVLLLWGLAALGQEQALVMDGCGNCVFPVGSQVPAMAAACLVGKWLGEDALREGAPDPASLRRDLGLAACLRGESLLRAGYLLTVKTDFEYALFELRGGFGADGWAWRARVGLAGLMAAQGRTAEALAEIRTVARDIAASLGQESLPWLEAKALESELASRLGDPQGAVAAARSGLAVAAPLLPGQHSLVLRLKRLGCLGLLARGEPGAAAQMAMDALGLPGIPRFTTPQALVIGQRLAGVAEASPGPAFAPTNDAEFAQFKSMAEKARAAQGRVSRARHDILTEALGLPAISGTMSVAARCERIQFGGPLADIHNRWTQQEEAYGIHFVRLALHYDEMRAGARLRGSYVGTGDSYADRMRDVARGDSLIPNDKTLPSRAADRLGTKLALAPLATSALNWLSLASMFPGEKRQSLLPGEAVAGLEDTLAALRRSGASAGAGPEADQAFGQALVHAQAATRGEVLANLLLRFWLAGDPSVAQKDRREAQQAIDGELWLRRQRGLLLDLLLHVDGAKPGVGRDRAAIRQLYLPLPAYGSDVSNRFFAHVFGGQGGNMVKGFESLTYFGAAKYVLSLAKARERLGEDEALVVWLPLERNTQVFCLTRAACRWEVIPEGSAALGKRIRAIRQAIRATLDACKTGKAAPPQAVPFPLDEAHALYRSLFGPIEAGLAGITHLYAVQFGTVGSLPLGLLPTRPAASGQEPAWLADRFALTRVPALVNPGVLAPARPPVARPARPLLAAGDPWVRRSGSPAKEIATASVRSVRELDELPPLVNARREMESAATLLGLGPADKEAFVLSGKAATRQAVLDRLGRDRFTYLLFATHGLVSGQDVGEPALVLSPAKDRRDLDDDGLLRASEVVGLNLDTDLVILSACETSPSGEDGAEPLAGLVSAFLVAGARSALSTQWPVVTEAAEFVSTAMIAELRRGGQNPAVVLQRVLRRLRSQAGPGSLERSPVYWAPFELVAFLQ
jgi:CHAT domain-containing protein